MTRLQKQKSKLKLCLMFIYAIMTPIKPCYPAKFGSLIHDADETDRDNKDIQFLEDFIKERKFVHLSPSLLTMCIPIDKLEPAEYMDDVLNDLALRISKGDSTSKRLMNGLAAAVNFKQLAGEDIKSLTVPITGSPMDGLSNAVTASNEPPPLSLAMRSSTAEAPVYNNSKSQAGIPSVYTKRTNNTTIVSKTSTSSTSSASTSASFRPQIVTKRILDSYQGIRDLLAPTSTDFASMRPRKMARGTSASDSAADALMSARMFFVANQVDYSSLKREINNSLNKLPKTEMTMLVSALNGLVQEDSSKADKMVRLKRGAVSNLGRLLVDAQQKVAQVGPKAMMILAKQVVRFGVQLLDHLYMSPEFLLRVPVVGETIIRLRQKGEPLYKIIEMVRHVHYLYKISTCSSQQERTRLFDSAGSSDMLGDDKIDSWCDEHANGDKVHLAKKIVSEAGSSALSKVALRVTKDQLSRTLSEEKTQEFMTRTAYAVLTFILPDSNKCVSPTMTTGLF